jgi:poly(A) polymerase
MPPFFRRTLLRMTDTCTDSPQPVPQLRVIPRDVHGVSRKQMSPNALRVLYRLREAGYGAYLVGGAVRDLLLGGQPKDFDVATDATPEQVKALFRNCRLIGRRFRLAHVIFGREIIEVATFRANGGDDEGDRQTDDSGRLLRDNVYGTIEEDAVRRDFTANALFYTIEDFSVRDYVGGYEDIQARVLRLIGEPEARYREDPVRMLRAARLAAKLGFSIDPATAAPIPRMAPLLAEASPARLFEETLKLFLTGHAVASFEQLERLGLLPVLLPETAQALAANSSGALRRMLLEGLGNTDRRVANGDPVSPAFLYAVLLWPAYCRTLAQLQAQGVQPAEAQRRAADRVTLHQLERTAMPRRFTVPMQEIWLLQPRFSLRQRKRVFRLLAHPRFRAAFDFLELRQVASDSHADDVAFWRQAQQHPAAALEGVSARAGAGDAAPDSAGREDAVPEAPQDDASAGAPRRRRRKPKVTS